MNDEKSRGPDIVHQVEAGTYHLRYDWNSRTELGTTILRALETITGDDGSEREPLYRYVDPDALDRIFAPATEDAPRDQGELSFPYGEYSITVRATGDVVIAPDSGADGAGRVDGDV